MGEIAKRLQECRVKSYGHVMRREQEYVGKRVMFMGVLEHRRKGSPKHGCGKDLT